jgi:hypothetical protein
MACYGDSYRQRLWITKLFPVYVFPYIHRDVQRVSGIYRKSSTAASGEFSIGLTRLELETYIYRHLMPRSGMRRFPNFWYFMMYWSSQRWREEGTKQCRNVRIRLQRAAWEMSRQVEDRIARPWLILLYIYAHIMLQGTNGNISSRNIMIMFSPLTVGYTRAGPDSCPSSSLKMFCMWILCECVKLRVTETSAQVAAC